MTKNGPPLIHVVATESHFASHLIPVWNLIPTELRGRFYTGGIPLQHRNALLRAKELGVTEACAGYPKHARGVAMISASGDLGRCLSASPEMRAVFFEHGCGISYNRKQNSYAGGSGRPNVDAFIFPNDLSADLQRVVHPDHRIEVIGASPKMDVWAGREHKRSSVPTIALAWHWDCSVAPETRSALYWYRQRLDEILDKGWNVIGHSHPRMADTAKAVYDHWGIEWVEHFDDVMERSDLLLIDNSSVLYEFAASDRPVVILNCPRYRRNVHHGLRFWDHIPGIQVDGPDDIRKAIETALDDPKELRVQRRAANAVVYPNHDGHSAERAAAIVIETLERARQNYPNAEASRNGHPRFEYQAMDSTGAEVGRSLVHAEAKRLAAKRGGRVIILRDGTPI